MENNNTKSKRSSNFSRKDESLLLELVTKYKHIIEDKRSDKEHLKKKEMTWETIEEEFNSRCVETYRSSQVLNTKFRNLKKREKRKKRESYDDLEVITSDPIEYKVWDVLNDPDESPCIYDSDPSSQDVSSSRKRKITIDKWQELAEEKCKLVKLQQKQSEEKHSLEMAHMKEEHTKKMCLLHAQIMKIKTETD